MEEGFVRRTYRSAAIVTAFVLFTLASYGQFWALLPVFAGAALGVALLFLMELFVMRLFTPERAQQAKKKAPAKGTNRAIIGFALVKYPLVAFLIWTAVHFWETRQVMAFAGGFILLHIVIALRAIGKSLVDKMNADPAASRPDAGRKE